MFGRVKIGQREVEMAANAASPYVYKLIFREDFLLQTQQKEVSPDIFEKMGFVMAKQAEAGTLEELRKLTEEDFYEWLSGFEAMDLLEATAQIMDLYAKNEEKTSIPKTPGE